MKKINAISLSFGLFVDKTKHSASVLRHFKDQMIETADWADLLTTNTFFSSSSKNIPVTCRNTYCTTDGSIVLTVIFPAACGPSVAACGPSMAACGTTVAHSLIEVLLIPLSTLSLPINSDLHFFHLPPCFLHPINYQLPEQCLLGT